ncbi:MAG: 4Fe-4S dicluster domain-containing protein [Anaerolineales bacterium]|nr:4Fe-4S dicluster domain-containing protein [Anaerolineales bacterium]
MKAQNPKLKAQTSNIQYPISNLQHPTSNFALEVQRRSGENVFRCYYCQKCTVGCPTAYAMDCKPAQVLKMIQLGMREPLLKSSAPWLCVGCETCGTRCPNEIRLAPVMDTLKYMSLEAGYTPPETTVYALHRAFLDSIKFFGRVHETTMLAEYVLRSRDIFSIILSNYGVGITLLLKRKIPILPERVKGLGQVKELYKRAGQ